MHEDSYANWLLDKDGNGNDHHEPPEYEPSQGTGDDDYDPLEEDSEYHKQGGKYGRGRATRREPGDGTGFVQG